MQSNFRIYQLFILLILTFSCQEEKNNNNNNNNDNDVPEDTPVKGKIHIFSESSFKPAILPEKNTFEGIYTNAKIDISFTSERSAIDSFLRGKTEMIVVGRPLNDKELSPFKAKGIKVIQDIMAKDAIAFVLNKNFPDSLLSLNQLRDILSGKVKNWRDISPSFPLGKIVIAADQSNSGNLFFLKDSLGLDIKNIEIFSADSVAGVIDYVKGHSNAMGIIGVSWLSDADNIDSNDYYKQIKVAGLYEDDKEKFSLPFQGNIADGSYPLKRNIYLIYSGARTGLRTGFASFILGDRGQKIILKTGIVPAKMPGRDIEFKYE
ncbi:phosphate ABC transporter periplasmic protein [Sporocytophaga myxococcoides]|uniref:Phosphate ABC transporter periplasmic protein n=1 Tax=Sporocytophaga myxococcoides TaxID=153721 RepID=A0A098LIN1_9BACT|nr:substrate-binding domain-containing protein [Sporocytophaga myxococcoides]GAL86800.1 phosphate ABC transporter periplasmic protein [Sporocytophaga myxococcoides]